MYGGTAEMPACSQAGVMATSNKDIARGKGADAFPQKIVVAVEAVIPALTITVLHWWLCPSLLKSWREEPPQCRRAKPSGLGSGGDESGGFACGL